MKGTGTVTVPQLSVSILPRDLLGVSISPRDRFGTEVKLFLRSCCLTTAPLHPGSSLDPSWITTLFRFSLPLLGTGERPSLFTSRIGVQGDRASLFISPITGAQVDDDGLSIRLLAGMSGVVTNLPSDRPFTGVLVSGSGLLPRNRRT